MQVIPSLLESITTGFHIGRAGYRPSDICVSAPTGSGKTLAFVLPIVQVHVHVFFLDFLIIVLLIIPCNRVKSKAGTFNRVINELIDKFHKNDYRY